MSAWVYLFDNEYRQRLDIERLRHGAWVARQRSRAIQRAHGERIDELEASVGELTLLCRALLTTLRERGVVDPAGFQATLERIDAEDGAVDGRLGPPEEIPAERAPVQAPVPRRRR